MTSLEVINQWTLAYRPTLRWLRQFEAHDSLCIVDAGCGSGDMLRRVASQFAGNGETQLSLNGVDLNPLAKRSAETFSTAREIRFITSDIFDYRSEQPIDLIICSLFTHHLSDDQIIALLGWMQQHARKGWFINDLHRHPLPYYVIKAATNILSDNRLIRHDAAVSVARSFSKADWRRLLQRAGLIEQANIDWHFPFRWCVSCRS